VQDAIGVSGQVLVAQKLGIARDAKTGTASLKYVGIARAISKRVLHMSLILGIGLGLLSQAVTPFAIPAVCKSAEVRAVTVIRVTVACNCYECYTVLCSVACLIKVVLRACCSYVSESSAILVLDSHACVYISNSLYISVFTGL
jgi:hypothetical protein